MKAEEILNFGKFKTRGDIQASQAHCTRSCETLNADPSRTHLNRQLFGDCQHLLEPIEAILQATEEKRKIRPDANIACEILITASPQWYRKDQDPNGEIEPEKIEQFTTLSTQFLKQEFGEHCISAILHLDETTPHIHAHFVPVHREKGWLSWEDWFGGGAKFSAWQDKYAEYLEPLGVRRGIKGSSASHETMQDFYERIHRKVEVPDLERVFCPPKPEAEETIEHYYQRVSEQFAQNLPPVQDALSTIVAHAKNEEFALRKAEEARETLHRLSMRIEALELQEATYQAKQRKLTEKQRETVAHELLTIANLILNLVQRNYWKSRNYIFSRRRGFTKLDKRDGKRLVHNQDGVPTLTRHFNEAELAKFRTARDYILVQVAEQIEQQGSGRSKRR